MAVPQPTAIVLCFTTNRGIIGVLGPRWSSGGNVET